MVASEDLPARHDKQKTNLLDGKFLKLRDFKS